MHMVKVKLSLSIDVGTLQVLTDYGCLLNLLWT